MSTFQKYSYVVTLILFCCFAVTGIAQENNEQQPQNKQELKQNQKKERPQNRQRMQQQRSNPDIDVSEEELNKFVDAMGKIQEANKGAQQKMQQIIEEEGLTAEEYRKIYQAKNDPQKEPEASEETMKKYKKAEDKIKDVQENNKAEIDKSIEEAGLTPKRYKEIYKAVRSDRELQQKVKKKRQKQQEGAGQQTK